MLTFLSVAWCSMVALGALVVFDMPPARSFPRPQPKALTVPDYMKDWPEWQAGGQVMMAEVIIDDDEEPDFHFSEEGGIYITGDTTQMLVAPRLMEAEVIWEDDDNTAEVDVLAMMADDNTSDLLLGDTDGKSRRYNRKSFNVEPIKDNGDWVFDAFELPADLHPQPLIEAEIVWHGRKGTQAEGKSWAHPGSSSKQVMTVSY